ncbi:multidrug and toxin extrusion protein 2 [Ilyonectria destructans]|nr:multidrug and toxin extrusion protein 2 [Ilyonectria destructans]
MDGQASYENGLFSSFPPEPASERMLLLAHHRLDSCNGKANSNWVRDARLLARNSVPLIVAGLLQHSLSITNIFAVGHLGEIELGAVSLSIMSANITGYAVYQGMATALDTLCAQAYGSGRHHLVGLYFQQMVIFLWLLTIPIGIIWLNADKILGVMVPDKRTADLAGVYMKILFLGAPGYALFEAGKRFVQSQGIFHAATHILLVLAPLNALLNWFLVWKLELGFIGAPISIAITNNLLPFCLFLYVYFIDGRKCWGGFTTKAFQNWNIMIKLAFPGFLMLEAEFLAFEVLTLAASYLSTTQLAAESIVGPLIALTFQAPFALAIAASTQIANLIGGGAPNQAKQCATIAAYGACFIGALNFVFMIRLGGSAAGWLTSDESVVEQVIQVIPIIATFQLFDSLAITFNGILRSLGKQSVGGLISVFCYYIIAMPISFMTAFWLRWELFGLWTGIAVALGLLVFTCCLEWLEFY